MQTGKRQLPEGWRWARLGEVGVYFNGRAFKPEEWGKSGLPIIRIENLNSPTASFNYFEGEIDPRNLINDGDLLISWSASLDAHKWCRGSAVLNQHIFKVAEQRDIITRDYLYFATRQAMREIRSQVHGATMRHITKPEFEAIQIPLPPLPKQKRITVILNEQMAAVERAWAAAEAQLEAAKALPAAFLRTVFASREAQQWTKKRFSEIARLERGRFSPRPRNDPRYYGGPYPWIQIGEVEGANKYITNHRNTLNEQGLAVSKMFPKGTLVISIAATIGAVGILTFDSCMPDSLVGITPIPNLSDSEFLYYVLLFIRDHLESIAPQMAQANLKLELLNPLEIPVPSLADQQLIAARLNEHMGSAEWARKGIEEELDSINKLPAALLRRAFSGEM